MTEFHLLDEREGGRAGRQLTSGSGQEPNFMILDARLTGANVVGLAVDEAMPLSSKHCSFPVRESSGSGRGSGRGLLDLRDAGSWDQG